MPSIKRLVRAVVVVCLFGLVGPPVGGLVAWTMMGARSLRSPLPFITGAYAEGAVLALLTGALCCIAALTLKTRSWLVPIGTAGLATAAWLVVSAALDPGRPVLLQALARGVPIFVPPATVAAVVCWALGRRVLRGL